jgi:hypothetical protein
MTAVGLVFSTPFGTYEAYGADDLASSIFGVTIWRGYCQRDLRPVSRIARLRSCRAARTG